MLGQKKSLNKFKRIEIIASIFFSDDNDMKLEINYKKKAAKNTNTRKLNSMLLNKKWITEKVKEEMTNYLETNENEKNNNPKPMGLSKSSSKREFYSNQAYLRKQEKFQINNLTLHIKELEKEELTKPKGSRKQNHKDQSKN